MPAYFCRQPNDRLAYFSTMGVLGRDLNAAINLKPTAASSAVAACGAGSADPDRKIRMKLPAMKQEPNIIEACP